MSKQIRLTAPALAAIALFFAGLFQSSTTSSQQSPAAATNRDRSAALMAATNDVLKETSELRQLTILRPVQSSAQSRPEIERMIMKNLDEDTTPAQLHAAEITLKRLGLAPADFQYRAQIVRVLTEQVAGYYEPKTGEFHLADWIDLDGQRPVMAHELTHALQDQHFNLRRFEHWPKGNSDSELAARALIEGDATLAMVLYVASNPLRALAFLKSMGTAGMQSQELEKAPRFVRENLLFPYQQGIDWTRAVYKQSGWNGVSQAFTELPQSTEQILHPDKYLAHEAPVKVTLPDLTNLLSAGNRNAGILPALSAKREQSRGAASPLQRNHAQAARADWRRLDSDVQGEWGFYLLLDQFLKAPTESRRAAAGWGGDRYAVYEGPKSEVLFASISTWDTENDAREFFNAYLKRTGLRYSVATPLELTFNMQTPSRTFRTSGGTVIVELRGTRVAVLEGLPERANGKSLLKALWLQPSVRP